jgi:hypothetical protein
MVPHPDVWLPQQYEVPRFLRNTPGIHQSGPHYKNGNKDYKAYRALWRKGERIIHLQT